MIESAPMEATWADAVVIARAGQWARWSGLPTGLPITAVLYDLVRAGPPPAVESRLGRRPLDRYDAGPLHVWAEHTAAVLVEWLDPPCATSVAELLAELGAPDREAAGRHLRAGATTTEYVYAARGLAITVAASYDQPPSFAPTLATVQLFATATLRDFVLELGGNDTSAPRFIGPGPR